MSVKNIDKIKGEAFNIGGGIECSLSLVELFSLLEDSLSIKMKYKTLPARESDQLIFIANYEKVKKIIGWEPKVTSTVGIKKLFDWITLIS
jgi:CDP-paratose 2-epimerase